MKIEERTTSENDLSYCFVTSNHADTSKPFNSFRSKEDISVSPTVVNPLGYFEASHDTTISGGRSGRIFSTSLRAFVSFVSLVLAWASLRRKTDLGHLDDLVHAAADDESHRVYRPY